MDWRRDVGWAVRSVRRNPGPSAVVIATLALGIGLNASVFSAVYGVLLRPLPYPEAARLVYIEASYERGDVEDALVSGGDWRALRDGVSALDGVEAVATIRQNMVGAGLPRQVQVGWVSPGFLSLVRRDP